MHPQIAKVSSALVRTDVVILESGLASTRIFARGYATGATLNARIKSDGDSRVGNTGSARHLCSSAPKPPRNQTIIAPLSARPLQLLGRHEVPRFWREIVGQFMGRTCDSAKRE
jgi:hypothetical protein